MSFNVRKFPKSLKDQLKRLSKAQGENINSYLEVQSINGIDVVTLDYDLKYNASMFDVSDDEMEKLGDLETSNNSRYTEITNRYAEYLFQDGNSNSQLNHPNDKSDGSWKIEISKLKNEDGWLCPVVLFVPVGFTL